MPNEQLQANSDKGKGKGGKGKDKGKKGTKGGQTPGGKAVENKCFQCQKPLSDKRAHPNGRFCPRPENANGIAPAKAGPASRNASEGGKFKKQGIGMISEEGATLRALFASPSPTGPVRDILSKYYDTLSATKKKKIGPVGDLTIEKAFSTFSGTQNYNSQHRSLDSCSRNWFVKKRKPRPAGYAACTYLYCGGEAVEVLLDYGATVSAISEEILLLLMEKVSQNKQMKQKPE